MSTATHCIPWDENCTICNPRMMPNDATLPPALQQALDGDAIYVRQHEANYLPSASLRADRARAMAAALRWAAEECDDFVPIIDAIAALEREAGKACLK